MTRPRQTISVSSVDDLKDGDRLLVGDQEWEYKPTIVVPPGRACWNYRLVEDLLAAGVNVSREVEVPEGYRWLDEGEAVPRNSKAWNGPDFGWWNTESDAVGRTYMQPGFAHIIVPIEKPKPRSGVAKYGVWGGWPDGLPDGTEIVWCCREDMVESEVSMTEFGGVVYLPGYTGGDRVFVMKVPE